MKGHRSQDTHSAVGILGVVNNEHLSINRVEDDLRWSEGDPVTSNGLPIVLGDEDKAIDGVRKHKLKGT